MIPQLNAATPKDRVRATRYVPHMAVTVATRTIGTQLTFPLTTENLSRTGLLLAWSQMKLVPFIENTILELVIDPERKHLAKPVRCLGKVVRRWVQPGQGPQFGVAIVQMDGQEVDQWESFLAELERSGAKIAAKPELIAS